MKTININISDFTNGYNPIFNEVIIGKLLTNNLLFCDKHSDVIILTFSNELSQDEINLINNIVISDLSIFITKSDIPFLISNKNDDPSTLDFSKPSIHELHEVLVRDGLMKVIERNLYKTRTNTNGSISYSDLAVKETIAYNVNAVTGILESKTYTIKYYTQSGAVGKTKIFTKYYDDPIIALEKNTRSSRRIISQATLWLMQDFAMQYGPVNAIDYCKDFFKTISNAKYQYENLERQSLIDLIESSTQVYITQMSMSEPFATLEKTRKEALILQINVNFA